MRILITISILFISLFSYSQTVCDPVCPSSDFTVNAACSFNGDDPSAYTYSMSDISAWGTAVDNGDGTFTITVNANATSGIEPFEIMCECPDLGSCESIAEFTVEIGGDVPINCIFETIGDGLSGTDADGNQGGCTQYICDSHGVRVRFTGLTLNGISGTAIYGAPINSTQTPSATWQTICNPCTGIASPLIIPVTLIDGAGCSTDTEITIEIKSIDQLNICPD